MPAKDDVERLWFTREAGYVKRNHIWPTLRQQTDGDHSYNAAMIYLTFHPDPQVETVREILTHDTGERGAGDMPAPAKWSDYELRRRYEKAEESIREDWSFPYVNLPGSGEELLWVVLCDKFEFALFCLEELSLGNRYARTRLETIRDSLRNHVVNDEMPKELMPLWNDISVRIGAHIIDDRRLF